ncbi:MAG: energy-coupling factor ABC transporter permease [Actinobacteria bacterium]|nr:energy-coupling factor ABC transporter permease [Actinomycetota bacterium]
MHIPDGFLDPKTWGTAWGISAGTTGYALYAARTKLDEKKIPLLGITAAFIFAAQMLNFPVAGGTSGHFLGALLAFLLVGVWPGFLVMVVVLGVQCLFFADGGLTALGANIFNMAIVGGLLTYTLFYLTNNRLSKFLGNRSSFLSCTAIFSWLSVMLASAACALELAVSGTVPLSTVLPSMLSVHAIIGTGEAIITTVVVAVVLQTRPDLVDAYQVGISTEAPALEVT